MKKIGNALKAVTKVIMLLTDIMMLLGGGLCVASNAFFAIPNLFRSDVWLFLLLMGVSALIAWIGWMLIKSATTHAPSTSGGS